MAFLLPFFPPTLFLIFLQKKCFSLKVWGDLRDKKLKTLLLFFIMVWVFLKFLKLVSRLRAIQGRHLKATIAVQNALYFFKAFGRSILTRQRQWTMPSLAAIKLFR